MRKYWIFLFYGIFVVILLVPFLFIRISPFIAAIANLLIFRFGLVPFLLVFACFTLSFLFDFFLNFDEEQCKENYSRLHNVLGRNTIYKSFLLSLLSGFSEELLFRGYLFFLLISLLKIPAPLVAIAISMVFGLFHVGQGKSAFFISAIISGVLCYYVYTVQSLIIPVLFHTGFNFIQLYLVMPLQEKRIAQSHMGHNE